MNWKASLDRYLTQEPPDDTWWFEQTAENIICSNTDYDEQENKIEKWMERLFDKGNSPEYAAKIISKLINFKK